MVDEELVNWAEGFLGSCSECTRRDVIELAETMKQCAIDKKLELEERNNEHAAQTSLKV